MEKLVLDSFITPLVPKQENSFLQANTAREIKQRENENLTVRETISGEFITVRETPQKNKISSKWGKSGDVNTTAAGSSHNQTSFLSPRTGRNHKGAEKDKNIFSIDAINSSDTGRMFRNKSMFQTHMFYSDQRQSSRFGGNRN